MNCKTYTKLILKNTKYSLAFSLQTARPYFVLLCAFFIMTFSLNTTLLDIL